MKTKQHQHLKDNQEGVVAIVVAIFLMLLMSLIVIAMSQNATREQRQSIDRQLSEQAFYNAESAINDVASYLYQNQGAPIVKNDCNPLPSTTNSLDVGLDGAVDTSGANKYTCVQYNKAPETIVYSNLSITNPKITPLQSVNASGATTTLRDLTISWDDSANREADTNCGFTAGSPQLPTSCTYGGVRAELIVPSSSRDELRQRGLSAFLLPSTSTPSNIDASTSPAPNNQGMIDISNCTTSVNGRRCSKTITNINQSNLFLNLRALYNPVNLTISGIDTNGQAVRFKDSQVIVDATGKASDVLRRVQVRIPATSQYAYPAFSLQTTESICKVISVTKNQAGAGSANTTDLTNCPID